MVLPLFHIASFEHIFEEFEKVLVGHICPDQLENVLVVQIVEAAFDVSLDKPFDPFPLFLDLFQGGVTASARSIPMRVG